MIGEHVTFGENVTIRHNCIIEDGVHLGSNVYIDSNTIIRSGTTLGNGTMVGANCIIGEYLMDFCVDRKHHDHPLSIGENSLIRSGTIIYGDSQIGDHFQTGHQVTIREKTRIGSHVSIGTLSDIQGECEIGDYVRLHSNIFVAPLTRIDSFVWIFPHAVLTDDPTPPSEHFIGAHIHSFAIIAAGEIIKVMAGGDIFGETYFEDVVQAYLANPQDTVFLTNSYLIGENDHFNDLKENQYEIFYKEAPDFEQETLFRRMYQGNLIFGTGMAAPREVHLKYGTFSRNNIVEDWELWLKWASTGKVRFQYIDKPDVYYRKSAGSMTSLVKNETMEKRWFALFDACENIIDKYGTYFSKEEYAKRKWEYFLYEGGMMRAYGFGDEKVLLKGRMRDFLNENGKYLPLIYHIRYYRMRLRGTLLLP